MTIARLLLPGMTLNRSAYPHLPQSTLCPDFNSYDPVAFKKLDAGGGMDVYVDLLDEWLSTQEAWDSPCRIVVAHSFGGMLAQKWLIRHDCSGPANIQGLVLSGTTAGPMYDVVRPVVFRLGKLTTRIRVSRLIKTWSRPRVVKAFKRIVAGKTTQLVDFKSIKPATDFRIGLAGWRNTDWQAMLAYRLGLEGFDVTAELGGIDVPSIVLHGSRDSLFPVEVGRALSDSLPNSQFRTVHGAGHVLSLTHPDVLTDAVSELLSGPLWQRASKPEFPSPPQSSDLRDVPSDSEP